MTLDAGGKLSGGPVTAAAYQLDDGTASADLSGPGSLTKDTNGTVVVSGVNSYAGGTVVDDGTLIVASSSALPAGSSLAVGAVASMVFDSAPASTPAAANGSSTPIVAASSPSSAPVTASALFTVSPGPSAAPLAPAETPAPSAVAFLLRREARAATPAALSPLAIDAVLKAGRFVGEHSVASPDLSQSAGPWAWPAAADKSHTSGATVAALDKVLAQYGL